MPDDGPPAGHPGLFGTQLRSHRERLGLTQDQLASRARLGARTIRDLEAGRVRRPRGASIRLLAEALGLDDRERAALQRAAVAAPVAAFPARPRPARIVGRERELERAERLLGQEDVRLLTLEGPPGVGKTHLAVALMASLGESMPDGVVFVDLAPLTDPGQVASAIRQALGPPQDGPRSPLEQVAIQIGSRRMLLVLDNFEHLLPAASLLAELLGRCPELRLLVTSRAALRLRDERGLAVRPLRLGDAVTLFVCRVEARVPEFEVTKANEGAVAEICRRLDCLPLALELVAPWLRLLEPEALLARLCDGLDLLVNGARDLPERQRTMRAALQWSYDLLEAEEQAVFRNLAVFAGGATLEALEALEAVHGVGGGDLLGLVARLADGNLVRRQGEGGELRVGMLEAVRQYGQELLGASGEADRVGATHARYYAGLTEGEREGTDREAWLDGLEREVDNLRAALCWAKGAGEVELGLGMAARLLPLWERRGDLREGLSCLAGWPESRREVVAEVRARALHARAVLAFRLGDHEVARADGESSLALHRELGDCSGIAAALNYLAGVEFEQGHVDRAVELCEESLALRRQLGRATEVARSLRNLGLLLIERRERRAAELQEEAVAIYRASNHRGPDLAWSLNSLADIALGEGRLDTAREYLVEALAEIGMGRYPVVMAAVLNMRGHLGRAEGDLVGAAASYRQALRIRLQLGHRAAAAYDIQGLAAVAWMEGRAERAAILYAAAAAVRTASGHHPERRERERHEPIVALVSEALGEGRFRWAWAAGRRLSFEEAVAEALREE